MIPSKVLCVITAAMLLWRWCFVVVAVKFGGDVGLVYGAGELVGLVLGVMNELRCKARDVRPVGLLSPVVFVVGSMMVPVQGEGHAFIAWLLLSTYLLTVYARLVQGAAFSVGVSTFVRLVERGPFAIVRHPEYALAVAGRLLVLAAWPSWWNAGMLAAFVAGVLVLIPIEETFLQETTCGDYGKLRQRVRWRLVPWVW